MHASLLIVHSLLRWLVLLSLLYAVYNAGHGYLYRRSFSTTDNAVRHWTATIGHIQLIVGVLLYVYSPIARFFWSDLKNALENVGVVFFGAYHSLLMLGAIILLTIGSALAKRKTEDEQKFKTQLIWFGIALVLILIAIPWPFSPLASRPYFRFY